MEDILNYKLKPSEAALWWLGQSGYIIRIEGLTIVIDPYLSDSAAGSGEFSRLYPPPINPVDLIADFYIITHDHLDHLDPDTLARYNDKESTWFIAPRLAAKKLVSLGIPQDRIVIINPGEQCNFDLIEVSGIFALPTGSDVLDTTGYLLKFENGRSIYHTSDTQFHPIVLSSAPKNPDVMLVPINGKWGNTGSENAALFAKHVYPKFVLPNHYDTMELNYENPKSFEWFCKNNGLINCCKIPQLLEPFVWGSDL